MVTVAQLMSRQKKYTYYLLALFVVAWVLTPYTTMFSGLMIGTIVSFLCVRMIAKKIDTFMEMVLSQGEQIPVRKKALGIYSRLAIIGLVVLIAVRYPDAVSSLGIGIGFMTGYFVIIIDYFYHTLVARKRGE